MCHWRNGTAAESRAQSFVLPAPLMNDVKSMFSTCFELFTENSPATVTRSRTSGRRSAFNRLHFTASSWSLSPTWCSLVRWERRPTLHTVQETTAHCQPDSPVADSPSTRLRRAQLQSIFGLQTSTSNSTRLLCVCAPARASFDASRHRQREYTSVRQSDDTQARWVAMLVFGTSSFSGGTEDRLRLQCRLPCQATAATSSLRHSDGEELLTGVPIRPYRPGWIGMGWSVQGCSTMQPLLGDPYHFLLTFYAGNL